MRNIWRIFFVLFLTTTACLKAQEYNIDELYEALHRAERQANNDSLAAACCRLGEYYAYYSNDSAKYYNQRGLDAMRPGKDTLYTTLLCNLGYTYFNEGNMERTKQLYMQASDIALEMKDTIRLTTALTTLGLVYNRLEMPDSTLWYYNKALNLLEHTGGYPEQAHLLSTIAIFYINRKRAPEAIPFGERAVKAAHLGGDMDMIMYAYYACGFAYINSQRYQEGSDLGRRFLKEAEEIKSPQYMLKAYQQIITIYDRQNMRDSIFHYLSQQDKVLDQLPLSAPERLGALETQANMYYKYGRYKESLDLRLNLLSFRGKGLHIPVNKLYLALAQSYRQLNDNRHAMDYYELACQASDSLHNEEVNQELSDLTVKYDTQQKELEILRLNKEQLEQKAQTLRWTAATVGVALLLLLFATYYVLRRKHARRKQELKVAQSYIEGMEGERARLAKELHDGVCNDLLGIGMQLQSMEPTEQSKQTLTDLLEQVRSDVRNVSHELMPPKFQHMTLLEAIEDYVYKLALPASMQLAFSNDAEDANWRQVPERMAYETYRILQETMSNIVRHSNATEVKIRLSLNDGQLLLNIDNNGQACPAQGGKGIGRITVQERAKAMGGVIVEQYSDGWQHFSLQLTYRN